MNTEMATCPICGHSFDPNLHLACQACPLRKGCQLICCPACGFEMVDIQKSTLARWASRWLSPRRAGTSQPEQHSAEDPSHDMAR